MPNELNTMLTFPTPPSPSPPPPPLFPPSPAIPVAGDAHHSSAPSLLIIVAIIAFVITASASIHLLLRLISRARSSPSPLSPISLSISNNESEPPIQPPPPPSDRDKLISSLPIFTLSSLQKSQSLDCAVCLSNFRPQDELRLLPACRHAFHSQCVDTWLRSTPSCPLCRASIHFHPTADTDPSRSGSFRVEIGSVSRRMPPPADGVSRRSYSLGSSFEYLVEDDVEAVLERMRRAPEGKPENGIGPPGSEVAEIAGSGRRGWIRDVVDRITSSASSSFNSLRFSGRIGGNNQGDLEANSFVDWEEESGFAVFYRWLAGV